MHLQHPSPLRGLLSALFATSIVAVLAACGTAQNLPPYDATPGAAPPPLPAASSPSAPGAPQRPSLAAEQVRLSALFRDTPVVFALQQDGSLRATVPLKYSFDAGAATVKPALAAVLDRLAKSQAQTNAKLRVSAPADPGARAATLAQDRAASVRDHLVARGIVAARVQIGGKAPVDQVEIVVSDPPR